MLIHSTDSLKKKKEKGFGVVLEELETTAFTCLLILLFF